MTPSSGAQREQWVRSKRIYEGRVVALEVGDVRLEDGAEAFREVVHHPGGVAIVPVQDDHVVLVRQFRIAVGETVLELPAGKLEGDESPVRRAEAELEEETGRRAGRWTPLGSIYASVGYTSEEMHLFLARDLTKTAQRLEADERVDVVRLSLAEVRTRLARRAIKDAKTIVGLRAALDVLDYGDGPP